MVIIIDVSEERARVDSLIKRDELVHIVNDNTQMGNYIVDSCRFGKDTTISIYKKSFLGLSGKKLARIYAGICCNNPNIGITVYDPHFEETALKIANQYEQLLQKTLELKKDYS